MCQLHGLVSQLCRDNNAPLLNDIGDVNELLRKVEEETETFIAESLAKEILDISLNQSSQCSATCRIRAICRGFRSRRGKNPSEQNSQNARCPVDNVNGTARKKKHYGLLQKTVPENNHKTQCRCVCHVSLYLAWVHTGNTFQSLILGQYRCSSSPCRYRGAGWIPRYCPRTRAETCTSP